MAEYLPLERKAVDLPAIFERYRAEVGAELRAAFQGRDMPLYDMLRYHLGWAEGEGEKPSGKALRPTLCLLGCEAVGGDRHRALPAAAALELVHNFSLIHDDIQDEDIERHHRPTVWYRWGKPQAINAGTAMLVLANLALNRLGDYAVPAQKQLLVTRLLEESCLEMIEGQYLDISYEKRLDITTSAYLEMIDKKTASLIACSFQIGALLGTEEEGAIASFRRSGRQLGSAFQIRDDILGIWGEERLTGKPYAADIRRKKKSLPVVYSLMQAQGKDKEMLLDLYSQDRVGEEGVSQVLEILDRLGAKEFSQEAARQFQRQALSELESLPLHPHRRRDFEELAEFLVERDF